MANSNVLIKKEECGNVYQENEVWLTKPETIENLAITIAIS
jgi:hypothetical protein